MNDDTEMDSDARELEYQERQLDQSFDAWVAETIAERDGEMHDMTDVPHNNVIDAAIDLDGD